MFISRRHNVDFPQKAQNVPINQVETNWQTKSLVNLYWAANTLIEWVSEWVNQHMTIHNVKIQSARGMPQLIVQRVPIPVSRRECLWHSWNNSTLSTMRRATGKPLHFIRFIAVRWYFSKESIECCRKKKLSGNPTRQHRIKPKYLSIELNLYYDITQIFLQNLPIWNILWPHLMTPRLE